jgi:hypothetical protein
MMMLAEPEVKINLWLRKHLIHNVLCRCDRRLKSSLPNCSTFSLVCWRSMS